MLGLNFSLLGLFLGKSILKMNCLLKNQFLKTDFSKKIFVSYFLCRFIFFHPTFSFSHSLNPPFRVFLLNGFSSPGYIYLMNCESYFFLFEVIRKKIKKWIGPILYENYNFSFEFEKTHYNALKKCYDPLCKVLLKLPSPH